MRYRVTALASDGSVLWSTEVACTSFDTAVSMATRSAKMAGVHSLLVAKV